MQRRCLKRTGFGFAAALGDVRATRPFRRWLVALAASLSAACGSPSTPPATVAGVVRQTPGIEPNDPGEKSVRLRDNADADPAAPPPTRRERVSAER